MKKIISLVLVIMLMMATAALTVAAANQSTLVWKDGFGFHCNNGKGNPKVTTGAEKAIITLNRVGTSTVWDLETSAANAIVCPMCQRIDWVTYSNKNGVINGKNIQVYHTEDNPVYLAKASATLILTDIIIDLCQVNGDQSGEKVAGTTTLSGIFKTNEKAIFNFAIPTGYVLRAGSVNPVEITFESKPNQNINDTVIYADKITIIECKCEGDFSGIPPVVPACGSALLCDNCQNSNGASHEQCWDSSIAKDLNYNKNTTYRCAVKDCPCGGKMVANVKFADRGDIVCSCGC